MSWKTRAQEEWKRAQKAEAQLAAADEMADAFEPLTSGGWQRSDNYPMQRGIREHTRAMEALAAYREVRRV